MGDPVGGNKLRTSGQSDERICAGPRLLKGRSSESDSSWSPSRGDLTDTDTRYVWPQAAGQRMMERFVDKNNFPFASHGESDRRGQFLYFPFSPPTSLQSVAGPWFGADKASGNADPRAQPLLHNSNPSHQWARQRRRWMSRVELRVSRL